jgi:flagellar hook-associated protein 1 FlgK
MSLTVAMRNALSGLNLNQFGLAVTSNNISNVNTPGYTRKNVEQSSRVANGIGSGVDISRISRNVNNSLVRDLRNQMSRLGLAQTQQAYLDRMQDNFGKPGTANALNANIGRLGASFEAMGTNPQNSQYQLNTVSDAQRMARQINDLANATQNQRAQADQEISSTITQINRLANQIQALNDEVVRTGSVSTGGQSATDAEDRRDQALRELSELIDVSSYQRGDGRLVVVVAGGFNLVSDSAAQLGYTPATAVSPATVFNPITMNGSGNLTSRVASGKLRALIDLRDTTLQNQMAQLDATALALRNNLNAQHNRGTSLPAQRTLTGTLGGLTNATALTATGITRISVVDANGGIVANADIDLATTATVGDLITAINTALGANGTASLVNGQLRIQAANAANGIAINENTSNVGGLGFSNNFGMNDFLVGGDNPAQAGDLALSLAVNPTLISNPGFVSRHQLSLTATAGQTGIAPGDGSIAQALAGVFTTSYAFSANGGLPGMNSTIADYVASIIGLNANLSQQARNDNEIAMASMDNLDKRMAADTGVNIDEEMSRMVVLENAYNASAKVIQIVNQMFEQLESIIR